MNFDYEMKNIYDVADIERAEAGKIYPKGTTMIALSASSNATGCPRLSEASEIESRYAAVVPHEDLDPIYLNHAINFVYLSFKQKYQTTINTQFGVLKFLEIPIHRDKAARDYLVKSLAEAERAEKAEAKLIENLKDMKQYYLHYCFPNTKKED